MVNKIARQVTTISAVTLGAAGLGWLINKAMIGSFRQKAENYGLEAMAAEPKESKHFSELKQRYTRLAEYLERVDYYNPLNKILAYAADFYRRMRKQTPKY